MELEKVTAEIRPRTPWEAIDLGVRLTAEHAISLVKCWMASVFPVALLILAVFYQAMGWGIFLIWWLKPLWERVALHPLSRSLFGEHPGWRETMKVLPREAMKNKGLVLTGVSLALSGWWVHAEPDTTRDYDPGRSAFIGIYWLTLVGLLFYRSGPNRSLALPVRYLEGLDRARYRSRLQTLSYRSSGSALGLMVICLIMEVLLFLSQVSFVSIMIPQGMEDSANMIWESLAEREFDLVPAWVWALGGLMYLNALSVVAWFYTGAGFGLYLNTRTWSEGWDIELKFKSLGQRLGLVAIGLVLIGGGAKLEANEEARRVLEQEEFKVETRGVYESDDEEDRAETRRVSGGSAGIFSGIGQGLFWVIAGLVAAGIIWVVVTNLHLFKTERVIRGEESGPKVRTVAGMNVEAANLPEDLVATARRWWEEGRHQEALSLLYRGAISFLVTQRLVDIQESDTELDCLRRVVSKGEIAHASYFKVLTEAWVSEAYARRTPGDETAGKLWSDWPFGGRRRA